jgi:hypothetical protein
MSKPKAKRGTRIMPAKLTGQTTSLNWEPIKTKGSIEISVAQAKAEGLPLVDDQECTISIGGGSKITVLADLNAKTQRWRLTYVGEA